MKKGLLGLSFSCNLVLLGAGAWHLAEPPKPSGPVVEAAAPVAALQVDPPATPSSPETKVFHWSEVESEDYTTYIARLREIGCPEPTIRNIVQGEVANMYTEKRREMQKSTGRAPDANTLRRLQAEQESAASSIMASAAESAPLDNSSAAPAMRQVMIPLVMRAAQLGIGSFPASSASNNPNITGGGSQIASANSSGASSYASGSSAAAPSGAASGPDASGSPEQASPLDQIREQFEKDVGGPNQDPTDPEYLQRWVPAQQDANQRIRGTMGVAYFNWYQTEVARKEYEASRNQ